MNITPIFQILIELIVTIIGIMVIPYIRSRYNASQLESVMQWTKIAVAAAEQLFDSTEGRSKRVYVEEYLKKKGFDIDFITLDKIIESAVLELHAELYGKER